jgi:hypothetical protein
MNQVVYGILSSYAVAIKTLGIKTVHYIGVVYKLVVATEY